VGPAQQPWFSLEQLGAPRADSCNVQQQRQEEESDDESAEALFAQQQGRQDDEGEVQQAGAPAVAAAAAAAGAEEAAALRAKLPAWVQRMLLLWRRRTQSARSARLAPAQRLKHQALSRLSALAGLGAEQEGYWRLRRLVLSSCALQARSPVVLASLDAAVQLLLGSDADGSAELLEAALRAQEDLAAAAKALGAALEASLVSPAGQQGQAAQEVADRAAALRRELLGAEECLAQIQADTAELTASGAGRGAGQGDVNAPQAADGDALESLKWGMAGRKGGKGRRRK
jgi:hypothetical protein